MRAFLATVRSTWRLFSRRRALWLPFLIMALSELFFTGLICLAPHPPFASILAPPLRYFFNERVLHYPWHLWFLYDAMKHTHFIASVLIGAFMSGIACTMVRQAYQGQPLSLRNALISRQVRYRRVVLIWLLTWIIARGVLQLTASLAPKTTWIIWSSIVVTVVIQTLLAYAIPAAVFMDLSWWKAIMRSIREAIRFPIDTLLAVTMASALVVLFAVIVTPNHVARWMMQTTPEIALVFVVARLVIWTAADAFLTVAVATMWWAHRAVELSGSVNTVNTAEGMLVSSGAMQGEEAILASG